MTPSECSSACAWRPVQQVGEGELVDVPQALERSGVEYLPFVVVQADEDVDGVANFVEVFAHTWVTTRGLGGST